MPPRKRPTPQSPHTPPGVLDSLGARAVRRLAAMALEDIAGPPSWAREAVGVLPDQDWVGKVPRREDIRRAIEDIDPDVDCDGDAGSVSVGWDPAGVREVARGMEAHFERLEENLGNAWMVMEDHYMDLLKRAVETCGRLGLAGDEGVVDAKGWMDTARALGLGKQARDVLMHQGRPDTHAAWLATALPLDQAWSHGLDVVRTLVRSGQLNQALAWAGPVLEAGISSIGWAEENTRAGMATSPGDLALGREQLLGEFWGELVADQWKPEPARDALVSLLEQHVGMGLESVHWARLMEGAGKQAGSMVDPAQLRRRAGAVLGKHRDKLAGWQAMAKPAPNPDFVADAFRLVRDGAPALDAVRASVRGAGVPTPHRIACVLGALDKRLGAGGGYAQAWEAAWLEAALDPTARARAKLRL